MSSFIKKYGLYIAWIVSLVAMGGSLYFSSVLGFPPCVLCWYQRIAIYPCTAGVSCTTKFIEYFGFITIPFLALVALIIITGTLLMYRHAHK
jgi:disulfide bond formation protein DsbB